MDLELVNSMLTTDIQKANLLELLERVKSGARSDIGTKWKTYCENRSYSQNS